MSGSQEVDMQLQKVMAAANSWAGEGWATAGHFKCISVGHGGPTQLRHWEPHGGPTQLRHWEPGNPEGRHWVVVGLRYLIFSPIFAHCASQKNPRPCETRNQIRQAQSHRRPERPSHPQ